MTNTAKPDLLEESPVPIGFEDTMSPAFVAASRDLEAASPAADDIDNLFSALAGNFASSSGYENAAAELSGRIFLPQVAGRVVSAILSGLLLDIRLDKDPDTIQNFKGRLRCAGHTPGQILAELDSLFFRPACLKKVLLGFCLSLDNEALAFLTEQAREPLSKFSAEEQGLILTLRDTPPWLCKAVSGMSAFCGLLSALVAVPYGLSAVPAP
ncbi:hypothetical protein NO2_1519, partial [Candidatus Termititenax persephonae]